jgi:hypothetical protein
MQFQNLFPVSTDCTAQQADHRTCFRSTQGTPVSRCVSNDRIPNYPMCIEVQRFLAPTGQQLHPAYGACLVSRPCAPGIPLFLPGRPSLASFRTCWNGTVVWSNESRSFSGKQPDVVQTPTETCNRTLHTPGRVCSVLFLFSHLHLHLDTPDCCLCRDQIVTKR